jgi:chorismate mutase
MINKNIIQIRKELDKLDDNLLNIIKKRSKLVDLVLRNKKFKKEIIDKKRISIILKNISRKSKSKNIDPKITHKIWKSMIKAFIEYEFRNFNKK